MIAKVADDVARFRDDPLAYVMYVMPWGEGVLKGEEGPDEWQVGVLRELGEYSARKYGGGDLSALQMATASGHGIGKTALVAWVIKWFMATRKNPQCVVTANTMEQLNSKTWRELAKWNNISLDGFLFTWTATRFYYTPHPDTWFASAIPWSESNSDAFQGGHEGDILVVFDEAMKIADNIWEAIEGSMSTRGAMWLAFGNPTRSSGRFYDCFHKYKKYWKTRHVDSRTAKKANKVWCDQMVEMYGLNSDRVKYRVLGQFPDIGERSLIDRKKIEEGLKYEAEGFEYQPLLLGVDIARFGGCDTVLQYRQGRKVFEPIIIPPMDLMATATAVAGDIKVRKPSLVVVDEIGIGAGVLDRLRQLGFSVMGGNSSNMSQNPRYLNKRAESAFLMKEYIEAGCELPQDDMLIEELRWMTYDFTQKGRMLLDSKKDFIDEYDRSCDRFDALNLTFFFPYGEEKYSKDDLVPEAFFDS